MEANGRNELNNSDFGIIHISKYNEITSNTSKLYDDDYDIISDKPLMDILYYFQMRITKVSVYFNELTYTHIEESAETTVNTLIAAMGGNLGLFVGMSLISLIEIIELFYYIFVNTIHSKLNL
jgi:hypothetical protein